MTQFECRRLIRRYMTLRITADEAGEYSLVVRDEGQAAVYPMCRRRYCHWLRGVK